jgi:ATP-dependent DNA helicase DinG
MSVAEKALEIYESLTGFEKRDAQRDMIRFMAECVDSGENGALEAPTGTGKSLATLVTAYAAWRELGYRSVISTNTHVLQSQMAEKDFFLFKRSLPEKTDFMVKSVMGKRRYICRKKKEEIKDMINRKGPLIITGEDETTVMDAVRLDSYMGASDDLSGERKWIDSAVMREDDPLAFALSCEGCIKKACPYYVKGCAYYRAIFFKSDVTVANHSLVRSFMGFQNGKGLMGADLYFFDEAHHLMNYSTSGSFLRYMQRPVKLVFAPIPEFYKDLVKSRDLFARRMSYLFDKFFRYVSLDSYAMAIAVLREMRRVIKTRWNELKAIPDPEVAAMLKGELYKVAEQYDTARNIYNDALADKDVVVTPEFAGVRELPDAPRSFTKDLKDCNENLKSCLFLSSTITVDGSYSAFRTKTGADFREGPVIPSGLPWHKAILWTPKALPSPRDREHMFTDMFASFCAKYIPPFVEKDLGGVLVLCTSLERMQACANALGASMKGRELLVQGQLPKRETMRRFLHAHSPVLVSSNSFREGFDAPGDHLTWLILDRLPFGPMEDEENDTAIRMLTKWGLLKNPFDYRLDMMKLALRQGVGRLIRSRKDYGAVTVFDSRVLKNKKWNTHTAIPVPMENVITEFMTPDEWVRFFQEKFLL